MNDSDIILVGEEPESGETTQPLPSANKKKPPTQSKNRAVNRLKMENDFLDKVGMKLKPTTRYVWLLLLRDTKPDGTAQTAITDLARRSDVSTRSIDTALKELKQAKAIEVIRRGSPESGPSIYRVRLPRFTTEKADPQESGEAD